MYLSINHETRKQNLPNEVVVARFLSLHLTAYAKDPDTGTPIIIKFWCVELLTTQGAGEPTVHGEEAKIRKKFLGAVKLLESDIHCRVLRGYATWLGDPAVVPGELGVEDAELVALAEEALGELAASGGKEPLVDTMSTGDGSE